MFHYTYTRISGKRERHTADIAVGDWVRSRYRSPWYGIVLALDPNGGCATVRIMLSKRGAPIRKPHTVQYQVSWFRKASVP